MPVWSRMKGKRKSLFRRLVSIVLVAVCIGVPVVASPVYASTDYTSTITEWLPLIVQFAMLGMIMGLLKKFGRW